MIFTKKQIEDTRDSKRPDLRVYTSRRIKNYRELVDYSIENYADHIAYKYRLNPDDQMIIEKTYEQAGNDIKSFGTALLNKGIKSKKVAVIGKNRYEWCMTYLAATTAGMIICPLDRMLPENEIANLIRRSGAEIVACDKQFIEIFKKLKASSENDLKTIICFDEMEEADKDVEYWYDVRDEGFKLRFNGDDKYDKVEIDEDRMSVLLFTSGTTSEAKGVMLSQKNVCTNIEDMATFSKMYDDDVILSVLPLHHTFECTISFLYGFYSGVCIAFCDGLRYYAKNLKDYGVTIIVAVPLLLETMYKKIQKGIQESGKEKTFKKGIKISRFLLKFHIDIRKKLFKQVLDSLGGKVRILYYGAAQMEKDTTIGYFNLGINSVQGYGLTETSPILTAETDKLHRSGTVGLCFPALDMKIIDKNEDGVGEICARGASIMLGYYKDEKRTKEAFDEEGYFKTGDYGYFDKDGFLHLTGRKNDIIVLRNGKNIYPDEIEGLINKIQYINESLVFARNEKKTDTLLAAKIVYDPDELKRIHEGINLEDQKEIEKVVMEDIKNDVNTKLSEFKHIKRILLTTEPMEKTTTQKIKRNIELKKLENVKI